MVLRENTAGVLVEGSVLSETLIVETATGVHGGLFVKTDSSDTAIELADATDVAFGVCGHEGSPADSQPTDVDTVYAADAFAEVIYGGSCVLMLELAKGFSVAKGDTLITWDNGQVAGPWCNGWLGIPFSASDNSETDTSVDLPDEVLVEDIMIEVTTVDATETISVGLLSTESGGDADGFCSGVSVATAGMTAATATVTGGSNEDYISATTYGALLADFTAGTDVATDVGTFVRKVHECDGTATSVTYTGSAGSDTAAGYIWLKLNHPNFQIAGIAMDTKDATSAADRVMTHFSGLRSV